jgi:transcriptional regulator with XRE-family HTH domain
MNAKEVEERLKKACDALGLSQSGLAEELGCSPSSLSRWRSVGEMPPWAIKSLDRLCNNANTVGSRIEGLLSQIRNTLDLVYAELPLLERNQRLEQIAKNVKQAQNQVSIFSGELGKRAA